MADTLTSRILTFVAAHPGCCATDVALALNASLPSVASILAQKRRIGILEHTKIGASHRQARYCKPEHPKPRVPKVRKNAKHGGARPHILMSQDRGKIEKWVNTKKIPDGEFRMATPRRERELHPLNRPDIFAHRDLCVMIKR